MATVYKCDRCGAELKPGKFHFINKKLYYTRLEYVGGAFSDTDKGAHLILCDNCGSSFVKWFANNGRTDGVSA